MNKRVGVDTGMILIIDPAYLFSEEEWQNEINPLAEKLGRDWPRAVLQILAERTGRDIPHQAVVMPTCGDGRFSVSAKNGYVKVETNCP